ncbi:cysteine-rich repeat secretory protein 38-like [Momordica charantia]|uniref:Cysteine-rich repeat secretory protein 38-like n=1 Tax=Momordica charantia TaxID=3673 RepID=A0A6J1C2W1_MOMCH|nr:cysteine-rich repeat secretory protein 38-like [Momordica charantia]
MRQSKPSIFFFQLPLLFLFLAAFGNKNIAYGGYLYHTCSSPDNFTSYSLYASNLKQALDNLANNAPLSGFGLSSTGGRDSQNQVNGLALCRGDIAPGECKDCVAAASREVQQRCPLKKGAAIWYDTCLLKYSNAKFFGKNQNGGFRFYMWNVQEASDPASFKEQVKKLLSDLSEKVKESRNMYAIGDVEIEGSKKVYGLAQCTRDLWTADCKKCLDDAIGELPSCCGNGAKVGGRVVGGSCNFRYETYPFFTV